METHTTNKPRILREPLKGAELYTLATAVAGAILWQTGVTFSELCTRRRRYENARTVFCGILQWNRADAADISRILNWPLSDVKTLIRQYRKQSLENPLFAEYSNQIRRFYYGLNNQ